MIRSAPSMHLHLPSLGLARAALIALCALSAAEAHGQVRLGPEQGGNYTVRVMSWWEIPFRTVTRQGYDFSCGSAAISTLLSYHYGRPVSERESFAAMWRTGDRDAIRKHGFSLLDMRTYLTSIGYRAEGFMLTMDQLRQVRRPTIVLLDLNGFKHFVVIKGMRGNKVLTGDPMLGLTQYPASTFAKHWNGIALAILATPDRRRPTFDLASDWGPWSQAPMDDQGAMLTSVGDLTSFLPPDYQISPQILLDVRVGTAN
ncbi:C39 family peptidase [Sphingomonas sp. BGYR3]|uniref:C39 family peptidase n=1 Tax=Sphingomonas sp. BGYR3 TaxID=2975483 RepID=UPI0021A5BC01|nr:C39 family peptidase [Sphingomonas sp. BGYR3]MDG5488814.1 C39 family peptidase [Sphingomonas sp. BGYR3]